MYNYLHEIFLFLKNFIIRKLSNGVIKQNKIKIPIDFYDIFCYNFNVMTDHLLIF